jgi:intracellular multiplication protein IcmL
MDQIMSPDKAAETNDASLSQEDLVKVLSAYDTVVRSHGWVKEQYRKIVLMCSATVVSLVLSGALNIAQYLNRPEPKYFAQTPDLMITEMIPLDRPRDSDEGVNAWLVKVVMKTLALDFRHWRDDMMEVKTQYTETAFAELVKSMNQSGMIGMIEEKHLVMNTVIKSAPITEAKGLDNGVYTWRIVFPILISYESSQGVISNQSFDITAVVIRVSPLVNPIGIQIRQLVPKPSNKKQ